MTAIIMLALTSSLVSATTRVYFDIKIHDNCSGTWAGTYVVNFSLYKDDAVVCYNTFYYVTSNYPLFNNFYYDCENLP
jgi:hypothetical protein